MAKIKVYELAKELNVQSKDVLEFLESKKIEVKNHMSALEETAAGQVKEHFSKNRKSEGESGEAPKKKNIVHVFRPQNTQNGNKHGRRQGTKQTMTQGRPMQVNNGRPAKGSVKPEAPKTEERVKTAEKAKAAEVKTAEKQAVKTEIKEENKEKREEKVVKNNEKRVNNDRPNSERTTRSERGDRSGRNDNRNDRGGRNDDRRNDRNGRNDDRRNDRGGRNNDRRNDDRRNDRGGRNDDRRNDRGGRNDDRRNDRGGRNNDRRNDRSGRNNDRRNNGPSIPAPEAPTQKPQRSNKGKGKDEHKKKDYRRDEEERMPKNNKKPMQKPQPKEQKQEEEIKSIVIPEVLTIKELADKMKVVPSVIVKKLFMQGKVVTVNQEIDYDTAEEIALEFDVLCEKEEVVDVIEELLKEEEEDEKKMKKRPPVVCVMGHVDHGKTSLLDAIRHTNVIGGEAGGITQHIGAYVVDVKGEKITFLDTPGHEAFTAMRMRGASSTDIAILVVAADDGVMPQTVEAINHAKAAGVEIIVAVNKIDKPSANIERVKQEMTEYELIPEDWGGSTIFVPVSAKTGEGLEDLMEMIVLTAEVMELKANPNRRARGLVLEAQLDKGRGPVSTVLVQKGTLRVGDAIAAGSAHGKVRAMMDDKGRRVKEAGPSVPVEILGLNDVPNA